MVNEIISNVSKVIIGKDEITRMLITAMISGGHVLLEDLPGSGKTKLAKALAKSVGMDFARIQFTPDLLPTDITGLNVYNREANRFELKKGPVFTNILLADEINRATPRTQAGLLECMEEHQVTIDAVTYKLDEPFFVIATQNPIETTGTFPLPEAQLDRFLMKLSMGYPTFDEELSIIDTYMDKDPLDALQNVASREGIFALRENASKVFVSETVRRFLLDVVTKTREHVKVAAGVSTRGTLALLNASKAYALVNGRDYCIPDDICRLAVPVLAHRIVLNYHQGSTFEAEQIISSIIDTIEKPTENFTKQ